MECNPLQSNDHAILEGWFWLPLSAVNGPGQLAALRAHLSFTPKYDDDNKGPVYLYDDRSRPGYIGIPRAYGQAHFGNLPIVDRTSAGVPMSVPRLPDPNHPRVKDPIKQAQFMADLKNGIHEYHTFSAMAATGSGKTVSSLRTAGELGVSTVVILHLERLLKQWKIECMDKLGLSEKDIGIIQQDKCIYENKPITLAMGPSLVSRQYDPMMYEYFGFKIVDELHKFGTRAFAPIYPMFPARYALGLSATLERPDGGDRVFFWHLGGIRVVSEADALDCDVHVLEYDCGPQYQLWGSTPQARSQCLSRDARRNSMIVHMIKRFYDNGRNALIVSDGVEHLQILMKMAADAGVPSSVMGQFTASRKDIEWVWDTDKRRKVKQVKTRKQKDAVLDDVKANSQLIFATYGMMTEGIDIPRLDSGIDATPKGKATQLIGRIRRPVPGKKKATWVTLRDVRCAISNRLFEARLREYAASGAEVYINGQKASRARPQQKARPATGIRTGGVRYGRQA